MRVLKGLVFFILTTFVLQAYAQPGNVISFPSAQFEKFPVKYPDSDLEAHIGIGPYSNKLILFVFLSPECPLSRQYTAALNKIANSHQRQLTVIGIFPGKSYDKQTIRDFLRKYKISFATYIDDSKKVTNYLEASVTPEVILLSNEHDRFQLQYRGAIDDRVLNLRVKKTEATNYYLENAIRLLLQESTVVIKNTKPVGCLINDY